MFEVRTDLAVEAAVAANDKESASAALVSATSVISKAESKGVYH